MKAFANVFASEPLLGLAAFALLLVFSLLLRSKRAPAWLFTGFFVLACALLAVTMTLEYLRVTRPASSPTANRQKVGEIGQKSSGSQSVNAAGVQGSVTVNNTATGTSSDKDGKKGSR